VHPDHAGKGLGRAMVELAESEAAAQGYAELRLNTHVDMPENVRLYAHLGWRESGREGNRVAMMKRV
jgi:GNAT superfamily N-acetyltransferase